MRLALIQSLESELSTLRQDLSEQYKLQSHNAQRLLSLTDQLRDAEERGREEREELRSLRHEVEGLREKQRGFRDIVADKEKQLLVSEARVLRERAERAKVEIFRYSRAKTVNFVQRSLTRSCQFVITDTTR